MPIYEYRCEKCGEFELSQRITEPALQRCPTCKRKVRRLISNTSFQLKGTGWYVTDYPRGSDKGKGKQDGTKDASADTSGQSTAESPKSETAKSETIKSESKKSASA